ncbi:hypothetical protein [Tetragenococcus halophilus]|nr:hypothetical protein [Tetragenococcus halophilus]
MPTEEKPADKMMGTPSSGHGNIIKFLENDLLIFGKSFFCFYDD